MPTECRSLTPMQEFYFQAGITWLEGGAGQQFNQFFMHAHVYTLHCLVAGFMSATWMHPGARFGLMPWWDVEGPSEKRAT